MEYFAHNPCVMNTLQTVACRKLMKTRILRAGKGAGDYKEEQLTADVYDDRNAASIPEFTSAWANSAATRTPFMIAFSFDDPWPMIHTPRTPSNTAPPYSE